MTARSQIKLQRPILILDFGSQYTQLIARRVREQHVFSVIHPYRISLAQIKSIDPAGIILSGGPSNVYAKGAPLIPSTLFDMGIPILGICYGMQLIGHLSYGGRVKRTEKREYGPAFLTIDDRKDLLKGLPRKINCWMSHGDHVSKLPAGFVRLAHTSNSPIATLADRARKIYGIQFHAEVAHTPLGYQIIRNFVRDICRLKGDWTPRSFIMQTVEDIRKQVGGQRVVLGLSGGVDSAVTASLIHKAIGNRLTCIFIDNGLLRKNEAERVEQVFRRNLKIKLRVVHVEKIFLDRLSGVTSPERKRKIIGKTFIDIFEREAHKLGKVKFLGQGTLYPDVIESVSVHGGPTSTIKSHHNVGGLPKRMRMKLVEPLRMLFKDEVRTVGRELGMPEEMIARQPFPGPGLAVRILGAVSKERCDLLREADWIVMDEIKKAKLYTKLWQSFAVLLPIKSVGVQGDERTYDNAAAIRAVNSSDGMTADWARLPEDVLARISNRIMNEVRGINRVCYDISSKPPATIEWE